jgi:predicted AAA+ superfamily ATPase
MHRDMMETLSSWKSSERRKPLLLNGARQVGKTWLLLEFGKQSFDDTIYLNFDDDRTLAAIFEQDYNMERIAVAIQAVTGHSIIPGKTLLILDEVQECPRALTSLKYFCEKVPELHVAAAGSLLGLTVHSGSGFPVGKVNMFDLYPMTFREFLEATGNKSLRSVVESGDTAMLGALSGRFVPLLKQYCYVGGMPDAVAAFVSHGMLSDARSVQNDILQSYRFDASKHLDGRDAEHVLAVLDSIPKHLSRENKKFVFGQIRNGARARDYRSAITWLRDAGIATMVKRVSKPEIPLSSYADDSAFKLFMTDIGLLGALSNLDARSIVDGNEIFTEFKGALAEQYVCQQLVSDCGLSPFYWSADNSSGEIDFLAQDESGTYAIEVKAAENLKAKSLKSFKQRNKEVNALRFSLSGYREQDWMRNIPLYAISNKELWS